MLSVRDNTWGSRRQHKRSPSAFRLAQEAEGAGGWLVYLFAKPHSHKKAA